MGQRHIAYMPMSILPPALENPKEHDLPALMASLTKFGWVGPAVVDERTERLVAGHGRREACVMLRADGESPPEGVYVDDDGEWLVPVLRGWHSNNDAEAKAFLIAENHIGEKGGWHMHSLAQLVEDIVGEAPDLLDSMAFYADDLDDLFRRVDPEKLDPGPRDNRPDETDTPLRRDDELITTDPDVYQSKTHTCPNCGFISQVA